MRRRNEMPVVVDGVRRSLFLKSDADYVRYKQQANNKKNITHSEYAMLLLKYNQGETPEMGCDIHLMIERKVDDRWMVVAIPQAFQGRTEYTFPECIDRNYDRFAKLAGVRGDGPKPLGVPADVSETMQTLVDRWGCDGHSHSYMPVLDAVKIFADTYAGTLKPYETDYPVWFFFGLDIEEDEEADHRIVFFFDN